MPNAVDLFCGAGGCSEGLIQAGFDILFSSDISDMVMATYVHRHEQLGLHQGINTWFELCDIQNLTGERVRECIRGLKIFRNGGAPEEIDLVIGGPSCQGFSRAGRRDPHDPRNMLFGEYVRVINELRPKYLVLENVEGFMDMEFFGYVGITGVHYPDKSVTPVILRNELELIGYDTLEPRILNAADYGVPQRRRRVIFIGYRRGLPAPVYPVPTHADNHQPIAVLPGEPHTCTTRAALSQLVRERFALFQQGENGRKLAARIQEEGIDLGNSPLLVEMCASRMHMDAAEVIQLFSTGNVNDSQIKTLLTKKNIRSRLSEDAPAPTIVSIPDDYISPWEDEILNVREMARCQSFDDSFEFRGKRTTGGIARRSEVPQCTQVGNAVPPLLARAIAEQIVEALNRTE